MFDNIGRVAEQVATSVSRRRFLGSVGRWAAAAAVGLAGLISGGTARADGGEGRICCHYTGTFCFGQISAKESEGCPQPGPCGFNATLSSTTKGDCKGFCFCG